MGLGIALLVIFTLVFSITTPATAADNSATEKLKKMQPLPGVVPSRLSEQQDFQIMAIYPNPPASLDLEYWQDYSFTQEGMPYPTLAVVGYDGDLFYNSIRAFGHKFGTSPDYYLGRLHALGSSPVSCAGANDPPPFLEEFGCMIFGGIGFPETGRYQVSLHLAASDGSRYESGFVANAQPYVFWLEIKEVKAGMRIRYYVQPMFDRVAPKEVNIQLDSGFSVQDVPRRGKTGSQFYQIVVPLQQYAQYFQGKHLTGITTAPGEIVEINFNYWNFVG